MAPEGMKLPKLDREAFTLPNYIPFQIPIPDPGDPPYILRFLSDALAMRVLAVYEGYLSKSAALNAQAFQARSELHGEMANILGKQIG